eukprot:1664176-Rhodomonas_salina.1
MRSAGTTHGVPLTLRNTLPAALGPESVVFEWGSGTSTLYYSQCVKNWTSIEHESEWCHLMQSLAPPNTAIASSTFASALTFWTSLQGVASDLLCAHQARIICVPIEEWAKAGSFLSPHIPIDCCCRVGDRFGRRKSDVCAAEFGSPGTWDGSIKEFKTYVSAVLVSHTSSTLKLPIWAIACTTPSSIERDSERRVRDADMYGAARGETARSKSSHTSARTGYKTPICTPVAGLHSVKTYATCGPGAAVCCVARSWGFACVVLHGTFILKPGAHLGALVQAARSSSTIG